MTKEKHFLKRLKQFQQQYNLKQTELAKALAVAQGTISNWFSTGHCKYHHSLSYRLDDLEREMQKGIADPKL
jgi:DNA-binding XRE family transcriptional regulator